MPIDWGAKDTKEIENLIRNFSDRGEIRNDIYREAIRQRDLRKSGGLDFKKSFEIIRKTAVEGRFVSYKELIDASGLEFNKVHYSISGHLDKMLEYTYAHDWPPLSAIVVNTKHVETGCLEPSALNGFLTGAKRVGYRVDGDGEVALRFLQQQVFSWAKAGAAA